MNAPYLAQEVVEEIIDMLVGDAENLRSCSLVSKSWINRSRHNLFAFIKLRSLDDLQPWLETGYLSGSRHHVRHLYLSEENQTWITPDTIGEIIASFCNVESLDLCYLKFTRFDECSPSEGFSQTLTSLTIQKSKVDSGTLPIFVCMFPNLDNLELNRIEKEVATIPSTGPTIAPRFRGKLALLDVWSETGSIVAPFLDPPLSVAFKDVRVVNCTFGTEKVLRDLFFACENTAETVELAKVFFDPVEDDAPPPLIDLSPLKGLKEITTCGLFATPGPWIERILRTVTSNRVRKITFYAEPPRKTIFDTCRPTEDLDLESWSRMDAIFLTMANKLDGTGEKLEVIFRNVPGWFDPVNIECLLEMCRTKATVRVEHS